MSTTDTKSRFSTPPVLVNPGGWGPTTLPEQFVGVPYNPFSKSDKLGKVADFTRSYGWRGNQQDDYDDGVDFNLVDTVKSVKPKKSFRSRRFPRKIQNKRTEREAQKPVLKGKQAKYLVQTRRRGKWKNYKPTKKRHHNNNNNALKREPSVKVKADWVVKEQFELTQLTKMSANVPKVEDLLFCGHLAKYDQNYDKCSCRPGKSRPLKKFDNYNFTYVTTLEDPNLLVFAEQKKGNVFATDELMAQLMCSTRSVHPWDLVFTRLEDTLFIDKRDDSNLEMLTVNETAPPQDPDKNEEVSHINTPEKLSIEATAINQNYSQQVLLHEQKKTYEHENPFADDEDGER